MVSVIVPSEESNDRQLASSGATTYHVCKKKRNSMEAMRENMKAYEVGSMSHMPVNSSTLNLLNYPEAHIPAGHLDNSVLPKAFR
ncbi:hypothetical protein Tcan_08314 [Toxocara canis]|uniref:Uncharacterized protein n=1 Tax=Toxocara canis TaxID=6265 RepID=A0A0B2VV95_TOXCA|nr:hypothetical protein Tcan_08314 [Toxocara canis]